MIRNYIIIKDLRPVCGLGDDLYDIAHPKDWSQIQVEVEITPFLKLEHFDWLRYHIQG